MIDCQELAAALWAERDGSLPEDLAAELEAHAAGCPSCAALRRTYGAVVELSASLRAGALPPGLEERINRLVEARWQRERAEQDPEKVAGEAPGTAASAGRVETSDASSGEVPRGVSRKERKNM